MPFGLCNAPTTFQRFVLTIFPDLVEKSIEVFMDDFSVFGSTFNCCLDSLDIVLKRCVETNLVPQLGEMSLHGDRRYSARTQSLARVLKLIKLRWR